MMLLLLLCVVLCAVPVAVVHSTALSDQRSHGLDSDLINSCQRIPDTTVRGHFSFYQWGAGTDDKKSQFQEYCAVPQHFEKVVSDQSVGYCDFTKESMSQAHQDEVVYELLSHKQKGYFIDLAANHWCHISNTYMLERYHGWKGLCIEGSPVYYLGLTMNRTCEVVVNVVSKQDNEIVRFANKGRFGGIVDKGLDNQYVDQSMTEEYVAVTLSTILRAFNAPHVIDYMSLDVEGAEHLVLSGFDFSKYKISIITVERPTKDVHVLLAKHKYWFVKLISSFGEALYVHHSYPKLNTLMGTNVGTTTAWALRARASPVPHSYLEHPKWHDEAILS